MIKYSEDKEIEDLGVSFLVSVIDTEEDNCNKYVSDFSAILLQELSLQISLLDDAEHRSFAFSEMVISVVMGIESKSSWVSSIDSGLYGGRTGTVG